MAKKSNSKIVEPYVYVRPNPYFHFYIGSRYYFRLMPIPYVYVMPDLKLFT